MDKIIERIRKLLALAGNNPSEAEREAALSKAHALLVEHNLQMQDVSETIETMDAYDMMVKHPSTWSRVVNSAIANLYFCKFVYTKSGRSYTAHFVGMRVDAEVAIMVASNIIESVARQAQIVARATGGSVASFKNAAAASIYWRCEKLRKEAEADKVPGTALVVQSLYKQRAAQADEWASNRWGKLRGGGRKLSLHHDAAGAAGAEFGRNVNITPLVRK